MNKKVFFKNRDLTLLHLKLPQVLFVFILTISPILYYNIIKSNKEVFMVSFLLTLVMSLTLQPLYSVEGGIAWIDMDTTNDSIRWVLSESYRGDIYIYKDGSLYKQLMQRSYNGTKELIMNFVDSIIVIFYSDTTDPLNCGFYFADRFGEVYRDIPLKDLVMPYHTNGYTFKSPQDTIWGYLTGAYGGSVNDTIYAPLEFAFADTISTDKSEWGGFAKYWWVDLVHMRVIEDTTFPLYKVTEFTYHRFGDSIYFLGKDMHLYKYIAHEDGSMSLVYRVSTPYLSYANPEDDWAVDYEISPCGKYILVEKPLKNPADFALFRAHDGYMIGYYTIDSFGFSDSRYKQTNDGILFDFPGNGVCSGGGIFGGNKAAYFNIDSMKITNEYKVPDSISSWTIVGVRPLTESGREVIYFISNEPGDTLYMMYVNSITHEKQMIYQVKRSPAAGFHNAKIFYDKYMAVYYGGHTDIFKISR